MQAQRSCVQMGYQIPEARVGQRMAIRGEVLHDRRKVETWKKERACIWGLPTLADHGAHDHRASPSSKQQY